MSFSELYRAKKSHCLNVVKPRTIMIMPHLVTPKTFWHLSKHYSELNLDSCQISSVKGGILGLCLRLTGINLE